MSTLRELFIKHGSDKAEHGYHAVYETLETPETFLEVGIFKGASLRAWDEWFGDAVAVMVGMDTFDRIADVRIAGVTLVKCDSRTHNFPMDFPVRVFDIIIDDGSHKPRDQAATFRNLWPLLAPGGRYLIEDVLPIDVIGEDNLPEWFAKRSADFNLTAFMELAVAVQNSRGTVIRHDFRAKSGKPDSVLVEVRKP